MLCHTQEGKQKYQGMLETKKSENKISSGDIGQKVEKQKRHKQNVFY